MTAAARAIDSVELQGLVPATVAAVADGRASVTTDGGAALDAALAVAGYAPRAGDRVLVATGAAGERYVIGVLAALREAAVPVVTTRDGVTASVAEEDGAEVLRVRDGAGRLVFEHRAGERRSVVCVEDGDLELRATRGNIDLVAGDSVRVRAARAIDLESEHAVRMATTAAEHRPASSVKLDPRGLSMATPFLDTRALRAEFAVGEGRLVARSVHTAMETAKHVVGVVETRATRIIERAKNTYRDVEELSQTRAGRMRLVAQTTFHLLGRRTLLKAEEDMKLKGEKIHLA